MSSEHARRKRVVLLGLTPLAVLVFALATPCTGAVAQSAPDNSSSKPATDPATLQTAPVIVDGETLFRLRGVSAFPAEQRAARVSQAVESLAHDPTYKPGSLRIVEQEGYLSIMAGNNRIVVVTDLDVEQDHLAAPLLAQVFVSRIDGAVEAYRNARQPKALLRDAGSAIVMVVGFWLAALLFIRFWRILGRRAQKIYEERTSKAPSQALAVVDADNLWNTASKTALLVRSLVIATGALFTLNAILAMFPWTMPFSHRALELVLGPLRTMGLGVLRTIPDIAFLAVLFFITRLLLRIARMFFSAVDGETIRISGFPAEWAMPTYRLVRTLIVVFALVVGYPYMPGSNSLAFKGISLFLGLVFSLGSSGATSNIVAGYSLTYRGAFHVGDRVKIGDVLGVVEKIRVEVTHLRTAKNEEVVIPNSQIVDSNVMNYSSLVTRHRLILHTTVGIGYQVPWRQVEAMLLLAARRTNDLLLDPPPFVLLKQLGDCAVVYEINVHCDQPGRMLWLYAELHRNILDVFNEYGVQITAPSYEDDPEESKVVAKDKWFEHPAEQLESLRKATAQAEMHPARREAS